MEIVLVAAKVVEEVDSAVVAKSSVHWNEEAVVGSPRDRLFLLGDSSFGAFVDTRGLPLHLYSLVDKV